MSGSSPLQLFCFPYAGASASTYLRWRRRLPASLEVVPVELPGHGRRLSEPLETTMAGVMARIEPLVRPEPGRRFAFFGHSLGALVAFECALRREQRGEPAPSLFVASGCHAPSQLGSDAHGEHPSDDALIDKLRRWGGTPQLALENAELMQLALPILRADLRVAAGYRGRVQAAIAAPIHVLNGTRDPLDPAAVRAWRLHTAGEFSLESFEGGHFFIHECEQDVLASLTRALPAPVAAGAAGALPGSPPAHE